MREQLSLFDDEQIKEIEVEFNVPQRAKLGDIWQLGEHRLMCGDSTDYETVAKLMNGKKADMVFTDPPYGVGFESVGVLNDNQNPEQLIEFNKLWVKVMFENIKENGSFYIWGTERSLMNMYSFIFYEEEKNNKIILRTLITWDKGLGQYQNAEYMRRYPVASEKCLFYMCGVQGFNNNADNFFEGWESIRSYLESEAKKVGLTNNKLKEICGVGMYSHWFTKSQWTFIPEHHYKKIQEYYKEKAFKREYEEIKREYEEIKREDEEIKREWYNTRAYFDNTHDNMNDVWHFKTPTPTERKDTGNHATPKPIALCSRAIKSSSRVGEIVLDLFGGSGSTLIACEQLKRICYMMELDPKYCDVIINRWEKYTGQKAKLLTEEN